MWTPGMSFSFADSRLVVPERVITRIVRGSTVLLNGETGQSYMLDEVGTRAWAALTSSRSIQDAYESLLEKYSVEPDRLKSDLETLIENLDAHGLLEIRRA
jgi:hypothetical protein